MMCIVSGLGQKFLTTVASHAVELDLGLSKHKGERPSPPRAYQPFM